MQRRTAVESVPEPSKLIRFANGITFTERQKKHQMKDFLSMQNTNGVSILGYCDLCLCWNSRSQLYLRGEKRSKPKFQYPQSVSVQKIHVHIATKVISLTGPKLMHGLKKKIYSFGNTWKQRHLMTGSSWGYQDLLSLNSNWRDRMKLM